MYTLRCSLRIVVLLCMMENNYILRKQGPRRGQTSTASGIEKRERKKKKAFQATVVLQASGKHNDRNNDFRNADVKSDRRRNLPLQPFDVSLTSVSGAHLYPCYFPSSAEDCRYKAASVFGQAGRLHPSGTCPVYFFKISIGWPTKNSFY